MATRAASFAELSVDCAVSRIPAWRLAFDAETAYEALSLTRYNLSGISTLTSITTKRVFSTTPATRSFFLSPSTLITNKRAGKATRKRRSLTKYTSQMISYRIPSDSRDFNPAKIFAGARLGIIIGRMGTVNQTRIPAKRKHKIPDEVIVACLLSAFFLDSTPHRAPDSKQLGLVPCRLLRTR